MNLIICDYQISEKDLIHFKLSTTYRRPMIVFILLVAVLIFGTVLIHLFSKDGFYDSPPIFQVIFSSFILIFMPIMSVLQAKRDFEDNTQFRFPLRMAFSPDFMLLTGKGFETKMEWESILKIREDKRFIKIYSQKDVAQLVPKRNIQKDTLADIRLLFGSIDGLDYR